MSRPLGAIRAARATARTPHEARAVFPSPVEELTKLADMLEKGLLTREEFDLMKAKLLGPPRILSVGVGKSSGTVRCGPYAGPTFQSCPHRTGIVHRLGSSIGSSIGSSHIEGWRVGALVLVATTRPSRDSSTFPGCVVVDQVVIVVGSLRCCLAVNLRTGRNAGLLTRCP